MGIDEVFKRAAFARRMDVESYRQEISAAIDRCYESCEPNVQKFLADNFSSRPSPEEFIFKLASIVKQTAQM